MNKVLDVIEVNPSGKRSWSGGPYCLCFVYSKYNGNFLVKGYWKDAKAYLKQNYTHYFVNYCGWRNGEHRDWWEFWVDNSYINAPSRHKTNNIKRPYKWKIYKHFNGINRKPIELLFKRIPKRWIPEFDEIV